MNHRLYKIMVIGLQTPVLSLEFGIWHQNLGFLEPEVIIFKQEGGDYSKASVAMVNCDNTNAKANFCHRRTSLKP